MEEQIPIIHQQIPKSQPSLKEGQDGRLQTEKRRCSLVGPVADEAKKARKGFYANVAQDETTHDGQVFTP
ncbi:hypothetical protein Vadar_024564 [Vaccinium darrowii]|uniref:Uncharacterized protein n=1 Tax=Vaccinium darrowii TaxID=229202 RepID=A0ACB7XJM4_9ERIC|nr:hypothetical protein Vadar_024564 [Vaccinium darrowii]